MWIDCCLLVDNLVSLTLPVLRLHYYKLFPLHSTADGNCLQCVFTGIQTLQ